MTTENNTQIILSGIDNLNTVIKNIGATRLLLVADRSFPSLNIRNQIESIPVSYVTFSEFGSNPLYEDVCKGISFFNKYQCNAILAVGGGSCIDVAKCIKLFCKMDGNKNYLQQDFSDSHIPLIAIPTTAGTGSESTKYAVIYYQNVKQSITHPSIIPTYAILEPNCLSTLPIYQKKCTVLDALCQGIESWWSINSSQLSQSYSSYAVRTLIQNIEPYIFDNNSDAAALVMSAANKAGQAINITQTTAPHAFSYKLTSLYHLPHGHSVAICLPEIWRFMISHPDQCIDPRGWEFLYDIFTQISNAMGCSSISEAISSFQSLLRKLDINYPVSNNRQEDIDILSHSVNPVRLKNNPIQLDNSNIISIYNSIIL